MPSTIHKQLKDQGTEPRHINMHLKYEETITQHNCIYCKRGIFRSHNRAVSVIDGSTGQESIYLSAPLSVQCPTCGAIYHLQTFSNQ